MCTDETLRHYIRGVRSRQILNDAGRKMRKNGDGDAEELTENRTVRLQVGACQERIVAWHGKLGSVAGRPNERSWPRMRFASPFCSSVMPGRGPTGPTQVG
jgi:hypothetical protein